jgi:GAF domain-containing protein
VSLSTVHRRIDDTVDRFIFRRQYREDVALRRFVNESAFVTQPDTLLDLAVAQLHLHVGAPWVVFYEYSPGGYVRVRQHGAQDLPQTVAIDDLALVKLRAHDSEVDLHEAPSGLGRDGYAFPLRARGHLLGVLVVGPRPGEHYAAEERELFAHVAHAVGASLFALRARETEEQLSTARAQALASEERAQVNRALLDEARAHNETLLEILRARGTTAES